MIAKITPNIIFLIIVVFLVIIGGLFAYQTVLAPDGGGRMAENAETAAIVSVLAKDLAKDPKMASGEPLEIYNKYLVALNEGDREKTLSFFSKETREGLRNNIEELGEEFLLDFLKKFRPKEVQALEEDIEETEASLSFQSISLEDLEAFSNGKAEFVKEEGYWKILSENWDTTKEVIPNQDQIKVVPEFN